MGCLLVRISTDNVHYFIATLLLCATHTTYYVHLLFVKEALSKKPNVWRMSEHERIERSNNQNDTLGFQLTR